MKAIVFDMGGVLFADGSGQIKELLEQEKGYDPEKIRRVIRGPERKLTFTGETSDEDFWTWAKSFLPPDYDIDYIRQRYYESYTLDEDILDLARALKQNGYTVALFSGNMKTRVEFLEKKYHYSQYFDLAVYSFECGVSKPDPAFTAVLISRLNLKPEEIFVIDDYPEYLGEYEQVGLKGALYTRGGIADLKKELQKAGIQL